MPYCSECAAAYETGARFCSNCGASLSTGSQGPGAARPNTQGPAAPPPLATWSVSPAAWAPGERVVAGATLFVFIALLVPWWSYGPYSIDGFHDWGWFSFVGFLAALALLCARLVTTEGRPFLRLPLPLHQAYAICAALELIGAVLYLAFTVRHLGFSNVSAGGFMALLGGGATLAGTSGSRVPRPAPALAGSDRLVAGPPAPQAGPGAAAPTAPRCPACGRPNPRLTRFCEGCGAKTTLGTASATALGEEAAGTAVLPLAPAGQPVATERQGPAPPAQPPAGSAPPVVGAPIATAPASPGRDLAGQAGTLAPTGRALEEDG